jgi:hypothetical protein
VFSDRRASADLEEGWGLTCFCLESVLVKGQGASAKEAMETTSPSVPGSVGEYQNKRSDTDSVPGVHFLYPTSDLTFPPDQTAEAFSYLEAGKHFGKVAIEL